MVSTYADLQAAQEHLLQSGSGLFCPQHGTVPTMLTPNLRSDK